MSAVLDRSSTASPSAPPRSRPEPLRPASTLTPGRRLRGLLLAGGIAAAMAAAAVGDPAALRLADPELARLLRGMAAIKLGIVLAAVGVLWWRFGRPVTPRRAAAYLAGAWLIVGASVLVWQLTALVAAALAFHVGELTLLCVAWRDVGERFR